MEIDGTDILDLGIPEGPLVGKALRVAKTFGDEATKEDRLDFIAKVYENPDGGKLATPPGEYQEWVDAVQEFADAVLSYKERQRRLERLQPREEPKIFAEYGHESGLIPENAREQMRDAMRVPVAKKGALMPDAHLGYGLPVGGVWGLENAVSPNAVGVDIGCRMKLSVFPIEVGKDISFDGADSIELRESLIRNTEFGAGSGSKDVVDHQVFDRDEWEELGWVESMKDKARYQLGSSGGGNHFAEWCTFTFEGAFEMERDKFLRSGDYLALLTHSGSRGFGFNIAKHYREIAEERCEGLPDDMMKLAWLNLDEESGQEYWKAMQLAGAYASACHEVIHKQVARPLKTDPVYQTEHHHNFAWRESHGGEELIVHRKGATPAVDGEVGIIPGTMVHGAYLVEGKGNPVSLKSCSHGAGRKMSRTEAKERLSKENRNGLLEANQVELIGAGLDEHPRAYKDLNRVMAHQEELCRPFAKISTEIVRMADD